MTTSRSGAAAVSLMRGVRHQRRVTAVSDVRLRARFAARDLHAVVDTLLAACGVPSAAISFVSPGVQTYAAEVGIGAFRTVIDDDLSLCAAIVDSGSPAVIADLTQDPVYWRNPLVQQGRVVSFAGEPLIVAGV